MFNFCPQCRSANISTINGSEYRCPDCGFVYYHNTASAVAGIITCDNAMLVTQRARNPGKGMFDLPGGFVDHGESLEQALSREVEEELGLTLTDWQYFVSLPNTYRYTDVLYHTCDAVFSIELSSRPTLTPEASEILQVHWLERDKIDLTTIAFPSLREAIRRFCRR
ncbi:NUDIX domain-containing protein [Alteromonas pelagimontana]|uniref:NUDIX domain-containing protein n=1 Tax=Alteromonas pelagimontana TaxID=1858656 RepID=A0A6M4MGP2_9ALTE|nr:NUDIX domain-containing protein [Alteromonas pelagimontana]QJR82289.1 NUDIX domain-containing protein [Alteromonas pelagimontana]